MTTRVYKVEVLGKLYLVDAATQAQAINMVIGNQAKAEVIGTSELAQMIQQGFPILRPAPKAAPAAPVSEGPQTEPVTAAEDGMGQAASGFSNGQVG